MRPPPLRAAGTALALFMLVVVLAATLVPADAPDPGAFQWCLRCGTRGTADDIANVLLFLPLAAGLVWAGAPGTRTVILGFLFSLTLELAQLRMVPGRDSTLGDVTTNTVGAALGVAFAWWFPIRRRSGRRALAAAAAVVAALAAGGALLRPHFPSTGYLGRVQSDLRVYRWYAGRIMSAAIGGVALPAGPVPASPAVRERLAAGDTLAVLTLAGVPYPHTSPIFTLFDTTRREILFVGNDHGDLVLRFSTRAADLGLDRPDLRWRRGMAAVRPGDTLRVEVWRPHGAYCVRVNGREHCGMALAAGRLWSLLQAAPRFPAMAEAGLDALFLLLLGLPIGLVWRKGAAGYAAVTLAVAGLVAVPPLVGLAPTPLVQALLLAAGILLGALLPGGEARRRASAPAPV